MSYCFVRVTSNYSEHIKKFYSNNPNYVKKSYLEQYNLLINDSFESASVYSKNLNKIGVKAFDIISNAELLQNTWKKEKNLPDSLVYFDVISAYKRYYIGNTSNPPTIQIKVKTFWDGGSDVKETNYTLKQFEKPKKGEYKLPIRPYG